MNISKDCDALLCVLYKQFLSRRAKGNSIERSGYFGDEDEIRNQLMPKWNVEDIGTLCWRLNGHGLFDVSPGDDKANDVSLTEEGLIYMEQRFPSGAKAVLEHLAKLAALVAPWL